MAYEKGNGKTAVIALGGNALGNTPQEQLELVQNTAKHIVDMIQDGTNVVVSHGNGPQVGMINNAFAYAAANDDKTPDMPFPEAGAMSQGYIGYQLSQAILNDLKSRDIMRSTACIVTQTVVDEDDPAFQNPTKPVGAFMDEETAKAKAEAMGITSRRTPAAAGARWSPPRSPSASWSSTPCATWWRTATWSCPPAAAGCRSSRPRTATSGPPRSSTRTAPAPSWPPSSAPTC